MKSFPAIAILVAIVAASSLSYAGDMPGMTMSDPPTDMGGMNMKRTLPPMPAIYAGTPDKPGAPLFAGYGDHTHKITTANPKTQAYFDQGVRLLFGFNHAEAIRSFREAARLDPDCAMCWLGVGFALGSMVGGLSVWVASHIFAARLDTQPPPFSLAVRPVALAAAQAGVFEPFETLLGVLTRPFEDDPALVRYTLPPREDERVLQTFCGT